jgi:hypothetical protein
MPWFRVFLGDKHINEMDIKTVKRHKIRLQPEQNQAFTETLTVDSEIAYVARQPHKVMQSRVLHLHLAEKEEEVSEKPH